MSPELPETLLVALNVIDHLERLGLRYQLGGSFASSIHGIPRQTQDIDLVVELGAEQARPLARALEGSFYVDEESLLEAVRSVSSCNLVHLETAIKIDLFVRGNEPFDLVELERHRAEIVQTEPERRVFVKSPEDTLLRKLQWYRLGGEVSERQWNDVLGILKVQVGRLDQSHMELWAERLGVRDLLQRAMVQAQS